MNSAMGVAECSNRLAENTRFQQWALLNSAIALRKDLVG
jgi:hypothetical protein